MFRLAWTTDIHLNFIRIEDGPKLFGSALAELVKADALVLTGDISEAPTLEKHLTELAAGWNGPLYFVLGNHDYYDGSFESVPEVAAKFDGWLENLNPVELTPEVALMGCEGWYDGLVGDPYNPRFGMSDWVDIKNFKSIRGRLVPGPMQEVSLHAKKELLKRCRDRSFAFANSVREKLTKALAQYKKVIFATHYPPFENSSWHEGALSDDMWRPWYVSKNMGNALLEVMEAHPDRSLLVLCGHTHSSGIYDPLPNLRVLTGEAVYRAPNVAGILEIEGDSIRVEMRLHHVWQEIR